MSSKVKLVLLAGTSGLSLAQELEANGVYSDLVQGADGVPKVLLGMNGTPVLNYWLDAIADCPRLQPYNDKVYIVTNAEMYPLIAHWASNPVLSQGSFPLANVINAGAAGGPVDDVAAFVHQTGSMDSHLVVVEADSILEPGFSLRRIVEHAMVRAKDMFTFSYAPPGAPLEPSTVLQLDPPEASVPRMATAQPVYASHSASDGSVPVLGPIAVLRSSTIPAVLELASGGQLPRTKQLGHLLAKLITAGTPVYGQALAMAFSLNSLQSLSLASDFYAYLLAQQSKPPPGEAAAALRNAQHMATLQRARLDKHTTPPSTTRLPPPLEAGPGGPIRDEFLKFWEQWIQGLGQPDGSLMGGVSAANPAYLNLPLRFADATARRHAPRAQHPCYLTSNNDYGLKKPGQSDMPNTYAASSQAFTNSFPDKGAARNSALITATTKSKVHKALDDF